MQKKIITSALPYVNNQPHLGNIVGCVLSADVYTRYLKKKGEDAIHICGTDEYGTAIEMAAILSNMTPSMICEENRKIHKKIYEWFDIHFDYFGRTTSDEHINTVQHFFKRIYENGCFEEKVIEQHFCDTCNMFLADRFVYGKCKFCGFESAKGDQCDACGHTYKTTDLVEPKCALCKTVPAIKETKHQFFNFDKVKGQLTKLYENNSQYWSDNCKQITKTWLEQELLPRCMTRDLKNNWGVPVPLDGYENKVFYVWFDAVIGYFTFLKEFLGASKYEEYKKQAELIQFMGKDNVFFHTIVFPSLIYATKETYPVVNSISATEFLMFENKKFSKSNGHGIFGLDLVHNKLGNSCIWRYYLMKIRPEKCDANFTFKHFIDSVDADLNNNIGNFCNRVLKYIQKNSESTVNIAQVLEEDIVLSTNVNDALAQYHDCFSQIKLRDALEQILRISRYGNEYVQQAISKKTNTKHAFSVAFSVVKLLSQIMEPFIPVSAFRLMNMCNIKNENYSDKFEIITKWQISESISPLFSKLGKETVDNLTCFKK